MLHPRVFLFGTGGSRTRATLAFDLKRWRVRGGRPEQSNDRSHLLILSVEHEKQLDHVVRSQTSHPCRRLVTRPVLADNIAFGDSPSVCLHKVWTQFQLFTKKTHTGTILTPLVCRVKRQYLRTTGLVPRGEGCKLSVLVHIVQGLRISVYLAWVRR